MKKHLPGFLSIFLAVVILCASTGAVISSHICLEGKKSTVALFENKGCCKSKINSCTDPSEQRHLKKNCCLFSVSFHKVDVTSFQNKISLPLSVALPLYQSDLKNLLRQHAINFSFIVPGINHGGGDVLLKTSQLLI